MDAGFTKKTVRVRLSRHSREEVRPSGRMHSRCPGFRQPSRPCPRRRRPGHKAVGEPLTAPLVSVPKDITADLRVLRVAQAELRRIPSASHWRIRVW